VGDRVRVLFIPVAPVQRHRKLYADALLDHVGGLGDRRVQGRSARSAESALEEHRITNCAARGLTTQQPEKVTAADMTGDAQKND
jgi:hypothetical protein